MEGISNSPKDNQKESIRRKRIGTINDLSKRVSAINDMELAEYVICLHYVSLDEKNKDAMIGIIIDHKTDFGAHIATNILMDTENLDSRARDKLLRHIEDFGDWTTINNALLYLNNLGGWRSRFETAMDNQ
jgi:hypothetical protein